MPSWENLKREQCPNCGYQLIWESAQKRWYCEQLDCDGFSVSAEQYREITEDQYVEFSGFCESCGRSISKRYRTCKTCY